MAGPWEKYAAPGGGNGPWAKYSATPAKTQTVDPTDGMTTSEKVLAGVGKSFVDTYEGIKQLGAGLGNKVGLVDDSTVDTINREANDRAKLDKPLMDTGAGLAGNIGGQITQMALPASLLGKLGLVANVGSKINAAAQGGNALARIAINPLVQSAAGGATFAGAQPVIDGESRTNNMLAGGIGGLVGQGIASGVKSLAQPAAAALSPQISALAAKAELAGIPINAAQLSDSKFAKTLTSALESLPLTGAQQSRRAQQEAFNRAVSKTIGEDVPAITNDVYATAKKRIGSEFERLSSQNSLQMDNSLLGKLAQVQEEATKFGSDDSARAVSNAIDELLGKADPSGVVPGKAYQSLDSKLGKLMKAGGEKSLYIGSLREAVRDSMDQSISAADKDAWSLARSQYKNLKTIRDLVAKEGQNGDINPALLAGRMGANNAGKEALAMGGGGDLGDLARIGRQFVRDPVPNSGTAQRLLAQGSLLGAAGGGSYLFGVDPKTTLLTLAAGATAGRGLNKLMGSKAAKEYMLRGSPGLNKLADLLTPAPAITTPLTLDMTR